MDCVLRECLGNWSTSVAPLSLPTRYCVHSCLTATLVLAQRGVSLAGRSPNPPVEGGDSRETVDKK